MIQLQDNLSMVDWLGGRMVGLGFWVGGGSLVLDVSYVSVWAIRIRGVGDNLGATIWKGHGVGSRHNLGIGGLTGAELGARVVIGNTVLESVWLWSWLVVWCGGMVWGWSWVVGWGIVSKGSSGQSTGNSVLEHGEGCWGSGCGEEGWEGVDAQSC